MVARRFVAVFFPAAQFEVTTRITTVASEKFKTEGKIIIDPGWLAVYGKQAESESETDKAIVAITPGETARTEAIEVKESATKPPPRYTEATLLSAMEGAGKLVEDEELREAMSERGLGTPATRAQIIEGLLNEGYLLRQGRDLAVTAKGISLITLLRSVDAAALTKPELTGGWESQLRKMEHGQFSRDAFMGEIRALTTEIVEKVRQNIHGEVKGHWRALEVKCPKCGSASGFRESFRAFECANPECKLIVWKNMSAREFEREEVTALLTDGKVGPLEGFRSKLGKPFSAIINLGEKTEWKQKFDFENGDDAGSEPAVPVSTEPLGKCPLCQGSVLEYGMSYACEHNATKKCAFRTGKLILQQPIDRAQAAKLLADGKTDVLKGFVSNKTKRKFDAFLVMKKGKVTFEFPPRERKGAARGAKPDQPEEKLDFTGLEPVGKCPACGGKVFETATQYICEKSQAEKKPCKFKSGKNVLGQEIDHAQIGKLLKTGRTDLLGGFVSKRGRTFKAFLVIDKKKKVGFEFESEGGESPRDDAA
jgi:DNA topoisomerase-3